MAKLIRAVAWRRLERPYTRKSKYREKAFIRAVPNCKIVKYVMGNSKKDFEYTILLKPKTDIQIRHNALESARKTSNKILEKQATRANYKFRIRKFPHHVLRNNPLAAGAGADRMSTGMKHSFGKTVGIAAQCRKGEPVIEIQVNKQHVELAKKAANRARYKFACDCSIEVIKNPVVENTTA